MHHKSSLVATRVECQSKNIKATVMTKSEVGSQRQEPEIYVIQGKDRQVQGGVIQERDRGSREEEASPGQEVGVLRIWEQGY